MAVAIAKMKQEGELSNVTNKLEFNVVELSDLMGWDSSPVKKELKMLEWILGQSAVFRVVNWHDTSSKMCAEELCVVSVVDCEITSDYTHVIVFVGCH